MLKNIKNIAYIRAEQKINPMSDKKAIILLADGFEESEAIVPCDLMRRAKIDVRLVSINKSDNVMSSHNIRIEADQTLDDDLGDYDLLMLPGGMPGTKNLLGDKRVCDEVLRAAAAGKVVTAICAAPMILGHLGLLQGKRATCYPGFDKELKGATYTAEAVVVDGNIITGRGAGAALHFGLELVAALDGKEKSSEIADQIVMRQ